MVGITITDKLSTARWWATSSSIICCLLFFILTTTTAENINLYSDVSSSSSSSPQCSLTDSEFTNDPAIQTMQFDLGYGPQEFRAYVQPDVSTFYQKPPGSLTEQTPAHNGWAAKFINMSPTITIRLFWDPKDGRNKGSPMSIMAPFNSAGTASFPGHAFYVTPVNDESNILARFVMKPPQAVYYYDPITVEGDNEYLNEEATQQNLDALTHEQFMAYQAHIDNRNFGKQYFDFTGREYLAFYPRNSPSHDIWRADYFGQEHWVTTKETHYLTMPKDEELNSIDLVGGARVLKENDERLLPQYRDGGGNVEGMLNMTLKVVSW